MAEQQEGGAWVGVSALALRAHRNAPTARAGGVPSCTSAHARSCCRTFSFSSAMISSIIEVRLALAFQGSVGSSSETELRLSWPAPRWHARARRRGQRGGCAKQLRGSCGTHGARRRTGPLNFVHLATESLQVLEQMAHAVRDLAEHLVAVARVEAWRARA